METRFPAWQAVSLLSEPPGRAHFCTTAKERNFPSDRWCRVHSCHKGSLLNTGAALSAGGFIYCRTQILEAQTVKNLPPLWETLGQDDPLQKEMATHSSILAWKIPRMKERGWLTVHGVAKSRTQLSDFSFFLSRSPPGPPGTPSSHSKFMAAGSQSNSLATLPNHTLYTVSE